MREEHYVLPIPPAHFRNIPDLMTDEVERHKIVRSEQGGPLAQILFIDMIGTALAR